jgi:hypothetical protein
LVTTLVVTPSHDMASVTSGAIAAWVEARVTASNRFGQQIVATRCQITARKWQSSASLPRRQYRSEALRLAAS